MVVRNINYGHYGSRNKWYFGLKHLFGSNTK